MTLSLPFSIGNSIDASLGMENTYQFDAHSQWKFNGADPAADPSIYASRPQSMPMSSGFGAYGGNIAEVVRGTPEALIEQNTFHLQLKITLGQCNQEIAVLKEACVSHKREFDDLKARYETLDKSHTMMIKEFAQEYHTMKLGGSDGAHPTLMLAGVLPYPEMLPHEEKLKVVHWIKDGFTHWLSAQPKGDTDANATIIATKAKAGRPRKSTDEDFVESSGPKHAYLEREDGTPISADERRLLSQKVHAVWASLIKYKLAPKTWGKLSSIGWEYYARTMLNIRGLEFLQPCDDSQWKLKEWSQQHYSGWALNNGIREARPPKKEAKSENTLQGPLDDEGLFWMEPSNSKEQDETPYNQDQDQSADDQTQKTGDLDPGTSDIDIDSVILGVSTGRNLHPQALVEVMQAKSIVINPLWARPVARPVTNTVVSQKPDATTKSPDVACTSQAPGVTPPVHTLTEPISGDMDSNTEASLVQDLDTSPSAPEMTQTTLPHIRLKLGPPHNTAKVTPVRNTSDNPPPCALPPAPGPSADPSPIIQGTSTTPDNTASCNIRLEHSLTLAEKKRKPAEDKLPSNKKPKCTPTALAIPSEGNTIKNVCM
ncbi:hypothetical protein EI94DRAFT_1834286 [Lactarius quietus]|nr:hypothetical protein EI94DRAFT_1834286 [Lactarius quietus]